MKLQEHCVLYVILTCMRSQVQVLYRPPNKKARQRCLAFLIYWSMFYLFSIPLALKTKARANISAYLW